MTLSKDVLRQIVTSIRNKQDEIKAQLQPGYFDLDQLSCNWQNATDNQIFESMSVCVFVAGMKSAIVALKWEGMRKGFEGFDIDKVANLEVSKLQVQPNMIKHPKKLEAVIYNARKFQDIRDRYGSFRKYLQQGLDKSFQHLKDQIIREFKYMGTATTSDFLKDIGMGGFKPDVHVIRTIERLGISNKNESIEQSLNSLAEASGLSIADTDRLLFRYGSGWKLKYEVCGTRPLCDECPVPVCNYANRAL
jgi:DNA-3-methyladenine glycosylase I